MVLALWSPSRAALKGHYECALSYVSSDVTFDAARNNAPSPHPSANRLHQQTKHCIKGVYPHVRPHPRQCASALIQ